MRGETAPPHRQTAHKQGTLTCPHVPGSGLARGKVLLTAERGWASSDGPFPASSSQAISDSLTLGFFFCAGGTWPIFHTGLTERSKQSGVEEDGV